MFPLLSSSLLKKRGRRLTAHRCLKTSPSSTARTLCILLGVTQVCKTSSPTWSTALLSERGTEGCCASAAGVTGVEGVGAGWCWPVAVGAGCCWLVVVGAADMGVTGVLVQNSLLKLSKASMSIVCSSVAGGMLHAAERSPNDGTKLSGSLICVMEKNDIYV